ncbi:MAG: NYN domain-containing protein [Deltaproteobacteria bacterium]|jgi:uncharacterized LabA/DUF88 family protein|nr:NYN domain-containing protein [Deltaproteobacteria bacterium]
MLKKPRLLVFVDEANVTRAASRNFNKSFDWLRFRDYLKNYGETPRELIEMVVYVGIPPDPKRKESRLRYVHFLKSQGFLVYTKEGQLKPYAAPRPSYRDDWAPRNGDGQGRPPYQDYGRSAPLPEFKANVDVIMAIDAMDLALRIRPDVVTLVTGDSDFAHLALTIRREGIKVEVASAPQTLSSELKTCANSVIDLTPLFDTFDPYEPKRPPEASPRHDPFAAQDADSAAEPYPYASEDPLADSPPPRGDVPGPDPDR